MNRLILCLSLLMFALMPVGGMTSAQSNDKPLILPMAEPASASTWLLGQPYGNTTGAFRNAVRWYSAGQGLHFGLDFSMPCGTPLVAVADGEVTYVDNFNFGSRPHNLIIQHSQIGLSSLYGHLLQTPDIAPGTWVTQGQVVGYSGDPDETCDSRPHLHYELRSLDYRTAYNPIPYMNANWNTLVSIGRFGSSIFEVNLDNSRQWQTLDDQPNVVFGGAMLNSYPLAYSQVDHPNFYGTAEPSRTLPILQDGSQWSISQLGFDYCCWRYWWSKTDTDKFSVVDGGVGQRAGIYEWSITTQSPTNAVSALPSPITSPDGQYEVVYIEDRAYLRHISTGDLIPTPIVGHTPAISPHNIHLLWIEQDEPIPPEDRPISRIYISNFDGTGNRMIYSDLSTGAMWLDDNRLLLTMSDRPFVTIAILNVVDGTLSTVGTWENLRDLTVSPGGKWLMFYLRQQGDPSLDGMYVITTAGNAQPQKLPWFGGWRWRDDDSVYYIPFDVTSDIHQLAYYHLPTGTNLMLTNRDTLPFTIMNGDWEVSRDGNHLLFHNALTRNLSVLSLING